MNPSNDGAIIRVVFPELSEERRREYIKVARHKAEDSRVSIRNIRRHAKDSIDKLVKNGDAGEDDGRRAEARARRAHPQLRRRRWTSCSSTRKPSSSRSNVRVDSDLRHQMRPDPREHGRSGRARRASRRGPGPGRNLPVAIGVGVLLGGLAMLTLFTVKATFLLYVGAIVGGGAVGAEPRARLRAASTCR